MPQFHSLHDLSIQNSTEFDLIVSFASSVGTSSSATVRFNLPARSILASEEIHTVVSETRHNCSAQFSDVSLSVVEGIHEKGGGVTSFGRLNFPRKRRRGRKWCKLDLLGLEEYRISSYWDKMSNGGQRLLFVSVPSSSSWMSGLPDDTSLGSLLLPGTHQSASYYGVPVSQCQEPGSPLTVQLLDGIRFLDIRLKVKNGNELLTYHGVLPERNNFNTLLDEIIVYLAKHKSETVILSIQQESSSHHLFDLIMAEHILRSLENEGGVSWFLEDRIPTLGEVRGQIVLFSRFGADGHAWDDVEGLGGMGIHPKTWVDSVQGGFEWEINGGSNGANKMIVKVHDWYNIGSILRIPEKFQLALTNLQVASSDQTSTIPISFFSASSFPFAFPVNAAKGFRFWGIGINGINTRLGKFMIDAIWAINEKAGGLLADEAKASTRTMRSVRRSALGDELVLKGWALLDFYNSEDGLVELLIALNFA